MINTSFENKPTEKLETQLTALKIVTYSLLGTLFALLAICIYGMIVKPDNSTFISLAVIPFALSPILFLNFSTMSKIKKELKSRD
jgi:hypothetical protein